MRACILHSPGLITSPEVLWQRETVQDPDILSFLFFKGLYFMNCNPIRASNPKLFCMSPTHPGKNRKQLIWLKYSLDLSTKSIPKQFLFVFNLAKEFIHVRQMLYYRIKPLALDKFIPKVSLSTLFFSFNYKENKWKTKTPNSRNTTHLL